MAVILDTGPLVALLNGRDKYHHWATVQFAQLTPPLLTCEAVLAESAHLLSRAKIPPQVLIQLLTRGFMQIAWQLADHQQAIEKLLRKYSDTPMSLTDACLVRMSEVIDNATVMTLDSDFMVYRRHGRQQIPLIAP